jgi:hypothetical protein
MLQRDPANLERDARPELVRVEAIADAVTGFQLSALSFQ